MLASAAAQGDRRQSRRLPALEGSFIIFDNHQAVVGRILDISAHGIACQIGGCAEPSFPDRVTIVGYHGHGQTLELTDIPLADVRYQHEVRLNDELCCLRLGLRFGPLSPAQRSRIQRFAQAHIQASAAPAQPPAPPAA